MAIAFVQVGTGVNNASATSVTDVFTVSAGSLLIIGVRIGATGRTVTVSDSVNAGNWSQVASQIQTTDGHQGYIFYKWNVGAGATTVTIGISGAAASMRTCMAEYSGALTSDPIDKTSTNQGDNAANQFGTADSNATATTSQANELLFGLATTDNTFSPNWTSVIGGGGTLRQQVGTFQCVAIFDLTVSATGAYHNAPTWASAGAGQGDLWTSHIATFLAPSAIPATVNPYLARFPKTRMRR